MGQLYYVHIVIITNIIVIFTIKNDIPNYN